MLKQLFWSTTCAVRCGLRVCVFLFRCCCCSLPPRHTHYKAVAVVVIVVLFLYGCSRHAENLSLPLQQIREEGTQSAVLCCSLLSLQPNSVENCEYIGFIGQSIASVAVAVHEKALQIGRFCSLFLLIFLLLMAICL